MSSKSHKLKLPINIITIIQNYLIGNIVYTKLALCNKKIREALLTSGLREERPIVIYIPKTEQQLTHYNVLKILKFSQKITIYLQSDENISNEILQANLDKLCDHLHWGMNYLRHEPDYNKQELFLEIADSQIAFPFLKNELLYLNKFEQLLTNGRLTNFLKFLDHIESFESIFFISPDIGQHAQAENCIRYKNLDIKSYRRQSKAELIIKNAREALKIILFQDCNFYGGQIQSIPIMYSSIEKLSFWHVNFCNRTEFGIFKCLKGIYFMNCRTYEDDVQSDKVPNYTLRNYGVTFEIIFKFIRRGNGQQWQQMSSIINLEADVYFEDSLTYNYPWNILTQIDLCILRDTQTAFTFSMISTLLKSTINIDKVSSLRPIYLQISKLKDLYVFKTRADINNNFAEINQIVNLNGMKILRDRVITYSNQSTVYIMQLKLQNMQGRPLNLTINQQNVQVPFQHQDI